MKLVSLASGSSGNCVLLNVDGKNVVIDTGIKYKKYQEKLQSLNIYNNQINSIFITHAHSDHISGLSSFLKNTTAKVYMTKGTFEKVRNVVEPYMQLGRVIPIEPSKIYTTNNIKVITIPTSHDAKDSVGFIIEYGEKSLAFITDTGYINEKYYKILSNHTAYFIEFNHDVEMLMNSDRYWGLKRRIVGDKGHLSNDQAANILEKVIGTNSKYFVLAHLSSDCNKPEIVKKTMDDLLKRKNLDDVHVELALQHETTTVIEIK